MAKVNKTTNFNSDVIINGALNIDTSNATITIQNFVQQTQQSLNKTSQSARNASEPVGILAGAMQNLGMAMKNIISYSAVNAVFSAITGAVSSAVDAVFEMDAALTEFKKVSDLSGEALEEYTDKATEAGLAVARTGAEIINAATEFRKSGFDDTQSLELARLASMFQNVADSELSAGEAASFITSQIKAFKFEAQDYEHILDAINEVSNNFAVSSTDISTALSKTSAAMSVLGNSFEETIGLVTAGTEILTGQASKVARG